MCHNGYGCHCVHFGKETAGAGCEVLKAGSLAEAGGGAFYSALYRGTAFSGLLALPATA